MENPYLTPKTRVIPQNEKVIDFLVESRHQMKVLNILRQEGMGYDEARNVIAENVEFAQAVLDKKNFWWTLIGWIFMFSGAILPVASLIYGYMALIFTLFLFAGLYCLKQCKKIMK